MGGRSRLGSMANQQVVMAGIGAGAVATTLMAARAAREEEFELAFSHATTASFDKHGVLHAIGTSFGMLPYSNPADCGLVTLSWSPDAANYYSIDGGHQKGTPMAAQLAASVICANAHPGKNATMWSAGKPAAWFALDLQSVRVMPSLCVPQRLRRGRQSPCQFQVSGIYRRRELDNAL